MKVAVLGASHKEDRYANRVLHKLAEKGHEAIGINPALPAIPGFTVVKTLEDLPEGVHTLTMYVGPERSTPLADSILAGGFSRVVFNPGAENPDLEKMLQDAGVEVLEACSLVMLSTGQWEPR
ncbi:MAG: CoA-binding protein [Fibrobacteria bacterium]|nr:CoA-binding protein [Fibrobacteria bacterium]